MRRRLPGLLLVSVVTASAYALHAIADAISPLTASVVLGVLLANTRPPGTGAAPGIDFAGRRLMRSGVALLGAEVSGGAVMALGPGLIGGVMVVVGATILGIWGLARLLRVDPELGLLIGVGYGVCGASAVAAARTQTRVSDEQVSYAVALVALCGTLSIGVLPAFGAALGLGDVTFGHWAGAAVHDVGQVVATASTRNDVALHAAIVVKLARVALLAPIVLLLTLRTRRLGRTSGESRTVVLPGFIVAFLLLAAAQSLGVIGVGPGGLLAVLAKLGMAMGLAALGLHVRWQDLRRLGGRPLLLGLLAWVLVAGLALLVVLLLG